MIEPKIYFGKPVNIEASNHDIFMFVPEKFKGDKDGLQSKARLKFIELTERQEFLEKRIRSGIIDKPCIPNRPKRRRIGQ